MDLAATPSTPLSDRKLVVIFGVLTGLGGILADAVLAHGLFWENDPYWTYWVTKTFLIMAVYMIGVSLLGLGLWQGVVITLVHTVVLTVYYDWLAPVGLPQEPEWLDMNHLWVTGLPAHFLVILCGYLGALWIWRRNGLTERLNTPESRSALTSALVGTVVVLVVAGIGHQLLSERSPASPTSCSISSSGASSCLRGARRSASTPPAYSWAASR